MEGGYGQAMGMRQGQGQGMSAGMGQGMGQGMQQGGYGVAANGQGLGVSHMGAGVGVNAQVPQMGHQQSIMSQNMGQGMSGGMGQGIGQGMVGGVGGPGNVQGSMMGGIPGMGMGDYQLEDVLGPFPCVRLRGLPFEATIDDVLRFFQGLVPLDVVMVIRPDGRGAGEAIVVLPNHMEMQMALSRDKQHMGRRYIEIFQSKRMDYYTAIVGHIQSQNMSGARQGGSGGMSHGGMGGSGGMGADGMMGAPAVHTGVIRMRGLPFSATKQDVINFFQGLPVADDMIQFVVRGDGRVTGEAFVSFGSTSDSESAMQRNGNHMGTRYVELFPSTPEEIVRHMNRT